MRLSLSTKSVSTRCFCLCTVCAVTSAGENRRYPTLSMRGEKHESTCAANEVEILKRELFSRQMQKPAQAWHILQTILCAPINVENTADIKSSVLATIRESTESTGDRPRQKC